MSLSRWWETFPTERYWLELTDRKDIGGNLRAPQMDEAGRDNWRYSLCKEMQTNDVVFHYQKTPSSGGIVGYSRVAGPWSEASITWAARGSYARDKGVKPHERPGIVVPLNQFTAIEPPVTLAEIRVVSAQLRLLTEQLADRHRKPLYQPFEFSLTRPLRMLQGYAFKLPEAVLGVIPRLTPLSRPRLLAESANETDAVLKAARSRGQGFGASAEENKVIETRAMVAATEYFTRLGFLVEDTSMSRPYDLAVSNGMLSLTVEVKGTTSDGCSVILTRNEVQHARAHPSTSILYVLAGIVLERIGGACVARGGTEWILWPWVIDDALLNPLQYEYSLLGP